jgi:hypothetical protein
MHLEKMNYTTTLQHQHQKFARYWHSLWLEMIHQSIGSAPHFRQSILFLDPLFLRCAIFPTLLLQVFCPWQPCSQENAVWHKAVLVPSMSYQSPLHIQILQKQKAAMRKSKFTQDNVT